MITMISIRCLLIIGIILRNCKTRVVRKQKLFFAVDLVIKLL